MACLKGAGNLCVSGLKVTHWRGGAALALRVVTSLIAHVLWCIDMFLHGNSVILIAIHLAVSEETVPETEVVI